MSDRIIVFELRRDNAWHAACSMVSVRRLYADLPSSDFSRKVLEAAAENLAVLPVDGWTDLGDCACGQSARFAWRPQTGAAAGASGHALAPPATVDWFQLDQPERQPSGLRGLPVVSSLLSWGPT
jgi:hypothetical protein